MSRRIVPLIIVAALIISSAGCGDTENFSMTGSWEYLDPMSDEELKMYENYPKDYQAIAAVHYLYEINDDGTFSFTWTLADKDGKEFGPPSNGSFNVSETSTGIWSYDQENNTLTFVRLSEDGTPFQTEVFSTKVINRTSFKMQLRIFNDIDFAPDKRPWITLTRVNQ